MSGFNIDKGAVKRTALALVDYKAYKAKTKPKNTFKIDNVPYYEVYEDKTGVVLALPNYETETMQIEVIL